MSKKAKQDGVESLANCRDEDLMAKYRQGDTQALDQLVGRYRLPLYHFLTRMTGCATEADEIFQDTWVRIINKPEGFRVGSFKGWVFTIARNLAIDGMRRNRKQVSLDVPAGNGSEGGTRLDILASGAPAPDDQANHRDVGNAIEQALACLTADQREVFRLRMEADMSFEEIAAVQGISRNTALGRMHYAITKLRSLLWEHNPALEREP